MKLKYYLRGLGIGILVTALIMGFTTRDSRPLTDAEIKAAAAELGMVESDSLRLADLPQEPTPTPEITPEPTKEPETTPEPEATTESSGEPAKESETTPEPAEEPENTSEAATETTQESGTDISVTVSAGSGSRTVCNRLEEVGVITDAAEFDKYLCDQGYSKRICVGTFEIPADASWEEIAKIITRSK